MRTTRLSTCPVPRTRPQRLAFGCSGARRSDEQLPAVGQGRITAVSRIRAVAVAVAETTTSLPGGGVTRHAATHERLGTAGFDHPLLDDTVVARHIHVDPRMRIDPFDACGDPLRRRRRWSGFCIPLPGKRQQVVRARRVPRCSRRERSALAKSADPDSILTSCPAWEAA
jgi:hypothetical protein